MGVFKKTRKTDHDRIAKRIAENIMDTQKRLADYLNGKVEKMPRKYWLLIVVCFCMVFGAYCLFLLIHGTN